MSQIPNHPITQPLQRTQVQVSPNHRTTPAQNNSNPISDRPDLLAVAALIHPGERVLDLGCGDGTLLRHLIDICQITGRGVELSEAGVLACVRKGISVRQGDLHEGLTDYPDHSFDTVILSYTIPYLNDPAFVIKEMLRVGLRGIVSFPNWGHWKCRFDLLRTGRMPTVPGLPQLWDGELNGGGRKEPRARPLTIADFTAFCTAHKIRIANQIYLEGGRRIPARFDKNLRATTAIFELV